MNIEHRQATDDRPTSGPIQCVKFGKFQMAVSRQPGSQAHIMFGSRVGFSGKADWTAPFPPQPNARWQPATMLEKFI